MEKLTSWTDIDNEDIQYYSGLATYTRNFPVKKEALSKGTEAFVAFGDIQEIARVFANGSDCGIIWTPPFKANISQYLKPGTNKITVHVTNTWNNRIVGDLINPDKRTYNNTNAKNKFSKKSSLLKSGLIGKAEIYFSSKNE